MKLAILALLVAVAAARIVPVSLYGKPEDRVPDEYIVQFFDDANAEFESFKAAKSFISSRVDIHEIGDYKGFAAVMTQQELEQVQQMPGVMQIEQSQLYYAIGEQTNVQAWGIDRSDQRNLPLNAIFRWQDAAAGQGVNVFILDTGVDHRHPDFQGRGGFVADCTNGCQTTQDTLDANGHGTHCAGSVAGATYGIAKAANVLNIRVLGANGSGSTAGIMNGITLVNQRPGTNVISMSLGGGFSSTFNNAVDASHRAGVINVVAAGNSNSNACNASPASAPLAVTVGATDRNDVRASFSSFGTCVDLFAPGVGILSTQPNGGTASFSGTSMACPHVAGAVAQIHSRGPQTADQVVAALIAETTTGVVGNPGTGSPNRLLFTQS